MKTIMKFLAAGLIVLLAACGKEKGAVIPSLTEHKVSTAVLFAEKADRAANPSNPYDTIGRIHNLILQATSEYVHQSGDTSITGRRQQVIAFFKTHYGEDVEGRLLRMESLYKKDFPGGIVKAVPENMFSIPVQTYLNRIVTSAGSITLTDGYDAFKATIVNLEKEVATDKRLNPAEQQKIFMVASVARYSISYWLEKANNNAEGQEASTMGFFGKVWRAINIGMTDIGAAIDGIAHFESPRHVLQDASDMSSLASTFL
jgi:hypothetical protein